MPKLWKRAVTPITCSRKSLNSRQPCATPWAGHGPGRGHKLSRLPPQPRGPGGIGKISIVACGTAYHAGLLGKHLFESVLRIPTENDLASEFRYRNPILYSTPLLIVISQSGNRRHLISMREGIRRGARVWRHQRGGQHHIREGYNVIYTAAGPEIAVASTEACTTQLLVLALLICHVAQALGREQE